ncbi:MAG: hypothetical protein F6K21_18410 [Symploca sp. SIO2D2]|nr:hypothetical protein [Symploca sp. SIO2D2]NER19267.1 hypothetical protein [Symploca sp. SIO1C2]
MEPKRIMLIGLGHVGAHVLDMILRTHLTHKILVAGRNQQYLHQRTNLSALSAIQLGFYPDVNYTELDVQNIEQTAHTISIFKPDIIFSSVSLQSWWVITKLPKPVFESLDEAQLGPWLPMHLTLVYKLMQAVKQTGLNIKVINASYPDVVNPILNKVGLSPTIGIGNVANVIPGLRSSIALKLDKSLEDVEIRLFAHHYVSHRLSHLGNAGGAPFHLTALVNGENLTKLLDLNTVFELLTTKFKRLGGLDGMLITAASATTVINAMANNTGKIIHAPAPNGLPGGYPVRVNAQGGEVILPDDLTLDKAIRLNEEGQRFDGIDKIEEDGTVYFTDKEMNIMKYMLGYECRKMTLLESEDIANTLRIKYIEFAKKYR